MTIEFIGMIHHRHASEIHPPANPVPVAKCAATQVAA
jgi:hypothetical protein